MILRQTTMSACLAVAVSLACATLAQAQAGAESFTATATVKTAGGAEATAPVTITIDRKMPEAEADKLVAAFKSGGAAGLRKALAGVTADRIRATRRWRSNTSAHHHRESNGQGPVDHYRHRQAPAVLGCGRSGREGPKTAMTLRWLTSRSMPVAPAAARLRRRRRSLSTEVRSSSRIMRPSSSGSPV